MKLIPETNCTTLTFLDKKYIYKMNFCMVIQKFKLLTFNTIIYIIFCQSTIITTLVSQSIPVQFDQITTEQGLPNNRINAILKDSKGFMWFGTADGLCRYDGIRFIAYKYDPDDSTSISGNFVISLYEDRNGNIWVGTWGAGLNRFDRETGEFTRFDLMEQYSDVAPKTSGFNIVNSIYEDPYEQGNVIWLSSFSGLTKFYADYAKSKLVSRYGKRVSTKLFKQYDYNKYKELQGLTCIIADDTTSLWLGTGLGLFKFNKVTKKITKYLKYIDQRRSKFMIHKIHDDKDGLLWLATEGHGLNKFDPQTGKFTNYKNDPDDHYSIGSNMVHDIHEDGTGKLWLITSGGGYYRFDKSTEKFLCYRKPQTDTRIGIAYWGCSYFDDSGIHWLGSMNDGIFKFAPQKERFNLYNLSSQTEGTVNVRALYKDDGDTLWVSTVNALFKFDTKTGAYSKTKYDPKNANKLFKHSISLFYEDANGILWLGTEGGGLKRYDFESRKINDFYMDSDLSPARTYVEWNNYIINLTEDFDGNLWMKTFSGGYIYSFNKTNLQYEDTVRYSLHYVFVDRLGNCFGGTWGRGLYQLERFKIIVGHYLHDPNDQNSISNNHINTMFEDKYNRLWIGTATGLNMLNRETHKFTSFLIKDGLASDNILSILGDDHGNLWLATPKGITRFTLNKTDPVGQSQIKNYAISEHITLYATGVCYKDNDGIMYFGGKNGFISFYPDRIKENTQIPPIVITDFKLFNQPVKPDTTGLAPLVKDISETDEIVLSHDQNFFSFEFAALDYSDPKRNRYAYKMEGIDQDWIYTDAGQRIANYTDIKPGEYIFKVKGSNNDDIWNEQAATISITILPPWYRTNLAYITYIFIGLVSLVLAWRFQVNRLKMKHLIQMDHFKLEKLQEVDQAKSRFFANISHEFRTPLTLIEGPIKQMISGEFQGNFKEACNLVLKNTRRLLNLINQLLDLSKLEAKRLKLQAARQNVIPLLNGLVQSFESLARQREIEFIFNKPEQDIELYIDTEKFEKIINNLLSNAFKFTPEGGRIIVDCGLMIDDLHPPISPLTKGGLRGVQISVSNTGTMLTPEQIEHIFDRFYQADESSLGHIEGTGIGLALVKELVELHHGQITVQSDEASGTTFIVKLPMGKEHLNADEIIAAPAIIDNNIPAIETIDDISVEKSESLVFKTAGRQKILIVEDNPDVRRYVAGLVNPEYGILEAENGEQALQIARKKNPDLIISDVMMPATDGMEFCRLLKEDLEISHIPVILLTARAGTDNKLEGLEVGADDYIAKPFEAKELLLRIRNVLKQRERLRNRFKQEYSINPQDITVTSIDEQFLKKLINIIETEMHRPEFSIEDMAGKMNVSRATLKRKIKALTNIYPSTFLKMLRLKRAKQLLQAGFGNTAEVAFEVGFNSVSYFIQVYTKQYGKRPSDDLRSKNT